MLTIEQRVQNGIDWLDQCGPENWLDKVELLSFSIYNACCCVLGQVFGKRDRDGNLIGINSGDSNDWGFYIAKYIIIKNNELTIDCGFDCNRTLPDMGKDFRDLQAEWTKRLAQLKIERENEVSPDNLFEDIESSIPRTLCSV